MASRTTIAALSSNARGDVASRIPGEGVVALCAGILALVFYLRSLAPTITWRFEGADSGDLVAAAFTLGIPHPPGYPLYTSIAAVFAHLPVGEPAQNVGLFSALAGATATILVFSAARQFAPSGPREWTARGTAAAAALALGFAPLFMSQAIIAEVYALNALLIAALLAIVLSRRRYRIEVAALVVGLGLAHHLSILLLVPTAVILLLNAEWNRSSIFRAGVLVAVPLLFYLYLPLRASSDPPINWGDPRTLRGFWWTVSAEPYRAYLFDLTPADVFERAAVTAKLLFEQFAPWGVALGLWGIARTWSSDDEKVRRQTIALTIGFVSAMAYALLYASRDSYLYLLPAFIIFVLWIAFALGDLLGRLTTRRGITFLVGAFLLLPAYNLVSNSTALDLSKDREAFEYARSVFDAVPGNAVILADGDEHLFALLYYRYVIAENSTQVSVISPELLQFDWYWDQARRNIRHPDASAFLLSNRIASLIELTLSDGRSIYTTALGEPFTRYPTRRVGPLSQIMGRP